MKSTRVIIFLLISILVFFEFTSNSHSLTIQEIEQTNYLDKFETLTNAFNELDSNILNSVDEQDRITNEKFETLTIIVNDAKSNCSSFSSVKDAERIIQNTTSITDKLKKINELNEVTFEFENDLRNYLLNCGSEAEYRNNITIINQILGSSENINVINGVLNGNIKCTSPSLQLINSNTKSIYQSYEKVRVYTDEITNRYNTSATTLSDSDLIIQKLSKENVELGEETNKIFQDLTFLDSKKDTESQEIDIIVRDLSEDYKALTTKQTSTVFDAKSSTLLGNAEIAISLDDKSTWYSFEKKDDFFQFLKLLNNSDSEVRLIQNKSLEIINKKNSIIKINASEISKTIYLDLLGEKINKNNLQIIDLNEKQKEIKPKIDKYNAYVKQLKNADNELRKDISNMTSALDKCKKENVAVLKALQEKSTSLSDDIKKEVKNEYIKNFNEKDLFSIDNPHTTIELDLLEQFRIIDNYSKIENRFTNCINKDRLEIITESTVYKTNSVKGVGGFSINSDPEIQFNNYINQLNANYLDIQPISQIDVMHYSNYLNKELIENRSVYAPLTITPENFNLNPYGMWTQEIMDINETIKIYECSDKNWNEVGKENRTKIEYGECKNSLIEPIVINYKPELGDVNQIIMSELNKFIQDNNIKIKGECSTSIN